MGDLGDLLERVFDPRFTCISAHLATSIDREGHRRAMERQGNVAVSFNIVRGGDPDAPPPATIDSATDLWYHRDGRYRLDQGPGFRRYGRPDGEVVVRPDQPALRLERPDGSGFSERLVVDPAVLLAHYHLELDGPEDVDGRAGVAVRGRWRDGGRSSLPLGLAMWCPVTETAELVFDRETGVLLRSVSFVAEERIASAVVSHVRVDDEVDSDAFDLPPETVVETEADDLRRRLVAEGVDVSTLDPDDIDALRRTFMEHHRVARGFGFPDRRARHQPTGAPPADEPAARQQIGAAFEGLSDRDEHGGASNVQGGSNLGPSLDRAAERYPGPTTIVVTDVLFLDARQAVVWFDVDVQNGPSVTQEGRALLLDGRWVVARETLGSLLSMAGIHIPAPE